MIVHIYVISLNTWIARWCSCVDNNLQTAWNLKEVLTAVFWGRLFEILSFSWLINSTSDLNDLCFCIQQMISCLRWSVYLSGCMIKKNVCMVLCLNAFINISGIHDVGINVYTTLWLYKACGIACTDCILKS